MECETGILSPEVTGTTVRWVMEPKSKKTEVDVTGKEGRWTRYVSTGVGLRIVEPLNEIEHLRLEVFDKRLVLKGRLRE